MKRALIFAAALLAASPASVGDIPGKPSSDPNPIVRIDGDTLTYIGGINSKGLDALSEAVRHLPRGQVTKMVVNSGGGDTKVGIYIGSVVAAPRGPRLFLLREFHSAGRRQHHDQRERLPGLARQ